MKILKDIYYLQAKNVSLALQIGTVAILNLRIELFTPFKKFRMTYTFSNFWLGYSLCDFINKLIRTSPRCFIKFYLNLYELTKKIRDKNYDSQN